MTVCAIEPPSASGAVGVPEAGCVITADGSYAARLAPAGDCWFAERWTLDGPEPYAVPLPGNQPEEPGTGVQPMGDGRVLVHRPSASRHLFSLLYPTGPGTGELPLGAVECPEPGTRLVLLPPAPGAPGRTPSPAGRAPARCGWWRAGRPAPSGWPRCRDAARAGSGWTAPGGCWRSTGSWAGAPRRSRWTWSGPWSRRCCRSRTTATTGWCSPTPTAGCC